MCSKILSCRTIRKGGQVKQRGQILLMYAFLIPMLFLFIGVTFDLSWYYLNVSRMQNAADAAVIAGARKLIDEEQTLSDYSSTSFVNGFNSFDCYEITRDISTGDKIAKTYVGKNLAKDGSTWDGDKIIDLWTRKNISFTSTLYSGNKDNLETLYYHVMLEEEVPHMFLNGWFPEMPAQVSSVARINYYLRGYDLFYQMKRLGDKQTLKNVAELADKKSFEPAAIAERSVLSDVKMDEENNRRVEKLDFTNENPVQEVFDDLITGFDSLNEPSSDTGGKRKSARIHRIINIDTTYPIRDYDFYFGNFEVLEKLRKDNADYKDLPSWELADTFSKELPDPLYIRIESERNDDRSIRQVIININVSNMEEKYRPIVFFYDGAEDGESLPVILNLNADFRGVLFAPNSPVVINGNGYDFTGFIVAQSFVELAEEGDDNSVDEHGNTIYVDYYGDVQYAKNSNGTYKTVGQNDLKASDFNIGKAQFDSFQLIKLEDKTFASGINLFTTEYAKEIK